MRKILNGNFEQYLTSKGIVKEKQYVIIGFSKSGTTSMVNYADQNGYDMLKRDSWMFNTLDQERKEVLNSRIPIILFRNPIERARSHYWFLFQKKPFEGVSEYVREIRMNEVCAKSVYRNYLGRFRKWNPILLSQEVLKLFDEFPVANRNLISKIRITSNDRRLIQHKMDGYGARGNKCTNNAWLVV